MVSITSRSDICLLIRECSFRRDECFPEEPSSGRATAKLNLFNDEDFIVYLLTNRNRVQNTRNPLLITT
jgi:hypothetical protein